MTLFEDLKGAFIEHIQMLEKVATSEKERGGEGVAVMVRDVRTPDQLGDLDGLIIPGGESTTLSVFLKQNGFEDALRAWIRNPVKPGAVWGTCAGLILLSDELLGQKKGGQASLGGLSVLCCRNAYGRQSSSFEAPVKLLDPALLIGGEAGQPEDQFHGIFIRAPGIVEVRDPDHTKILATLVDGDKSVVAVQQGHIMATTFHPELTNDSRWHRYFISLVSSIKYPN
ncbi:hypothetical protein EMCRGX_G020153 [Ephydatia muelleri]